MAEARKARYFLLRARAGAGEKNTQSRSKTDRLRNTAYSTRRLVVTCRAFTLKELRL